MSSPKAVLVTVGDELLLGRTVDTNAAWLGEELGRIGFRIVRRHTVADDEGEIQDAARDGLESADLVVLTGGLGPTSDDLTRESVAKLLGRALRTDRDLLSELEERFRARGFDELPEKNVSQARVPEGAAALANPRGTAPGLVLTTGEGVVVALLPGVPAEMKGIFREELLPILGDRFQGRLAPVFHRTIHTTGISESVLGKEVEEALPEDTGPVSVAFLPDERGVDLRLTARDVSRDEARTWFDRIEGALEPVVSDYRFESESGDLVETVARAMEDRGLTLATAESCTGGLVAKRLTDRAGASAYFVGGVVAYANGAKIELLGVDPGVLETEGAVSEAVALAMARGVSRRLGADAGLAITGIAGPEGGTEEKPVGTVWYSVHLEGETTGRRQRFVGDREQVRERSAQAVLALLLDRVRAR